MYEIDQIAIDRLFMEGRSYKYFEDRQVDDTVIEQVYNLARMAPSTTNTCPMRLVFAISEEAKDKVISTLIPGNVDKSRSAPVIVIVAYDLDFYEQLPLLSPYMDYPSMYARMSEEVLTKIALRNSSIQGGIFILAARACGLDCGPMSGFSNKKIDELFFSNSRWRSNFLINLGYGTDRGLHPRAERLAFEVACSVQ